MPKKQSSNEVSAIAGKYVRMPNLKMWSLISEHSRGIDLSTAAEEFFRHVRKMAAFVREFYEWEEAKQIAIEAIEPDSVPVLGKTKGKRK